MWYLKWEDGWMFRLLLWFYPFSKFSNLTSIIFKLKICLKYIIKAK